MEEDKQIKELAQGLRDLADFVEAHPELGAPYIARVDYFSVGKDRIREYAKAFGSCEKKSMSDLFVLSKRFGPIALEANWNHEEVCERVVVGTEEVEEKVPVIFETKKVLREKIEWRCPEVLKQSS